MAGYLEMSREELLAEQQALRARFDAYKAMDLKLDMSRGKPEAAQLDLSLDLLKIEDTKDATGVDARNYGLIEGLPEARAFFAELLGAPADQTMVGGNASLQLMYTVVDLGWRQGFADSGKPWSECAAPKFLCPVPGYDRHFRITESFGFTLVPVPMLPTGPDMDVVEELVKDESVKGMWNIPIYSNPDGYVYSAETVRRLAAMETGAKDFRIMWDNAYLVHHLTDEALACPNLLVECEAAGNPHRALMFCSTSKITFAGAGVSAMAFSKQNYKDISDWLFTQTIGFDKLNQLRHVRFLKDAAGVAAHMKKHAAILAPKFQMVQDTLHAQLSGLGIAHWTQPKGGYFVSFYALPGTAKRTVALCAEAGVVLTGAGAAYPYGNDPEDTHIRIAPSFPPIGELQLAAELLCVAARLASVEKLLQV